MPQNEIRCNGSNPYKKSGICGKLLAIIVQKGTGQIEIRCPKCGHMNNRPIG